MSREMPRLWVNPEEIKIAKEHVRAWTSGNEKSPWRIEYIPLSEAQELAAKAREEGKASALRFALHLIEEHGIPEGIQAIRANAARCAPTQPSRKGEKDE